MSALVGAWNVKDSTPYVVHYLSKTLLFRMWPVPKASCVAVTSSPACEPLRGRTAGERRWATAGKITVMFSCRVRQYLKRFKLILCDYGTWKH